MPWRLQEGFSIHALVPLSSFSSFSPCPYAWKDSTTYALGQVSLVLSVPPHFKLDASCCLRLPPAPAAVGFNNAMISNVGMVLRNIYSKKYLVNYKVGKVWCAGYGNGDCWSVGCYR